jgi:hypothetical protein
MMRRMNIYDNVPYKTSSLPKRPPLAWPDGRKVAVCIVISTEYYEMQPPAGSFVPPNLSGRFGRAPCHRSASHQKICASLQESIFTTDLEGPEIPGPRLALRKNTF